MRSSRTTRSLSPVVSSAAFAVRRVDVCETRGVRSRDVKRRSRRHSNFYRGACNATHDIAVVILSVCPSVRLSVRCVHCDKTKWCTADILIPHETAITLVFWHQQWLVGDGPSLSNICWKWPTPFEKRRLRQVSAYNVSTVGDSEKKFNYDQYKVDHELSNEL